MENNDLLRDVLNKLDEILASNHRLEERVRVLESSTASTAEQTADIHQFVPFVGWLNNVANLLPSRLLPSSARPAPQLEDGEAGK